MTPYWAVSAVIGVIIFGVLWWKLVDPDGWYGEIFVETLLVIVLAVCLTILWPLLLVAAVLALARLLVQKARWS